MKSKKVLTILLSLAIMVTFMPTVAFAGQPGSASEGHVFTPATDNSNVETIVEPTCETPGVGVVSCTVESGGVECGATDNQVLDALGHSAELDKNGDVNVIEVTADEYYANMLKAGYTKAQADAWMVTYGNNMCVGEVSVCKNCGLYLRAGRNTLSTPNDFGRWANTEHVAPATGMKACDASFTCVKCGKKEATNATYNATTSANYHGFNTTTGEWTRNAHWTAKGPAYRVHSIDENTKYVSVQDYECDECGMVMKEATVHGTTTLKDFSHPNTVTMTFEPDCTHVGASVVICTDCGFEVSRTEKAALGHDYVTTTVEAATEAAGEQVADICTRCGAEKAGSRKTVSLPLEHKVTSTVLVPKNCEDNTWVLVSCSNPDCQIGSFFVTSTTATTAFPHVAEKIGEKYYTTFGNGKVEIPFEEATGHTYGDATKLCDATCCDAEMEGRVCSTCGAIYHTGVRTIGKPLGHTVKEVVVPATCGAKGYTYKFCTTCENYMKPNAKTGSVSVDDVYDVAYPYEYDWTDPVVEIGAKCDYQWASLDDETDALICTVCKDVKEGSETPKTDDAKKAAQVEKAKPIIEAAANILAESDVYTAASVAAIEEAKANLNSAIAAGTSTDVKNMAAALQAAVDGAKLKDANTMTASGKTIKASKNKTKTFKKSKAFSVKNAKGKVTFAKKSGNGKIVVSKKGKVTVKSGLKKGTYKVKVAVTAAGNGNYLPKTKVVTLKVKVK
jgi:hypothetical protein